jgi:hypothetical protein
LPLEDEYSCASDEQCVRDGQPGVCEDAGHCAFTDDACPISRRRFAAHSGDLSETCVVRGSVYWVSPTGSDDNPGTEDQPFATIGHGVTVLAPGDGLLVAPGTYEESNASFPPGASWEAPITIAAWPRRGATLRSPSSDLRALEVTDPARFVSIEGFIIDGSGGTYEPVKIYQDNIRLRDCEIFGSPAVAVSLNGYPGDGGHCQMIDLDINGNGTALLEEPTGSPAGGIIASTGNNLFERCRVHDNIGVGLMVYNSPGQGGDGNVIRNNVVSGGTRDDAAGIFLSSGAGSVAYNNIVHEVSGPGIRLDYGAVDCRVLHNTVYAAGSDTLQLGVEATGTLARNNILAGADGAEGVVYDANEEGVSTLSTNIIVDPLFVDAAAGNFRVQPGSPAIDQGTTEPEVTVDFDGTPRPRGAGYDVGAFER